MSSQHEPIPIVLSQSSAPALDLDKQPPPAPTRLMPWTLFKTQLHECWLNVYGPLFWIVTALVCFWETRYQDQSPSSTTRTATNIKKDVFCLSPLPYEDHHQHATAALVECPSPLEPCPNNNNKKPEKEDQQEAIPKKSLKRSIKNQVQAIKAKHQTFNEAMKRSLLFPKKRQRRGRRNSHSNAMDSSKREMDDASSPPASFFLNPLRRKTAPEIHHKKRW